MLTAGPFDTVVSDVHRQWTIVGKTGKGGLRKQRM